MNEKILANDAMSVITKGEHNKKRWLSAVLSFSLGVLPLSYLQAENTTELNAVQVQDNKTISGIVVDNTGEPMIGVSVLIQGTGNGTITDIDGRFSINANTNETLVFSYIGFENSIVKVDKADLRIVMSTNDKLLDEVIVVGYGTVRKRDLTGSVSTIKSSDITLTPNANPMEALQGRVPGLDITKTSGRAGEGVTMQLRGNRSINASGNPLFIIDGMAGDYSTVNPNDIESIEVLKDASSTAVYGSAGANGVVLITTKQGQEGKSTINLNSYVGFNGWSKNPVVHDGNTYFDTRKLALLESGNFTTNEDVLTPQQYQSYLNGQTIDWLDAILQTGVTQNYSLSVSGGTQKTKAYFSLNYSDEEGQYQGDSYQLLSTNLRIDQSVTKWLSAGVNLQGSYSKSNRTYSKMENVMRSSPYGSIYDESGNLNVLPVAGDEQTYNWLLNTTPGVYENQTSQYRVYLKPYLRITPFKGFTWETRVNASVSFNKRDYFQGLGSYQYYLASGANSVGVNNSCYASIRNNRSQGVSFENIAIYNFKVQNDHDFTLTGVFAGSSSQSDSNEMTAYNISSNKNLWHNMGVGNNPLVSSVFSMNKMLGFVGRVNYSYMGKYLFSASVREDGNSILATGNKWATFPAVSLGWRLSDEKFMESTQNWLTNLKLRGGYGVTGTAGLSAYSSVSTIDMGYYAIAGEKFDKYEFSKLIANSDLTWEYSYNTNIGFDMGILNNRIDLSADFYTTRTEGVIWTKPLPVVNGGFNASTLFQTNVNICSTRNTGFEATMNTRNVETRNFKWNSTVTFSTNREKITKLADNSDTPVINGNYALSVGHPVHSYFNYKLNGVWQYGEEADAAVFGQRPGDLKIEVPGMVRDSEGKYSKVNADGTPVQYDVDNKYAISKNDYQIIGSNNPDWTMGMQNTFTWKNFDLSIYMMMRWGQMINYSLLTDYDPRGIGNFPQHFDYWTSTNPSSDFPALNSTRGREDYDGFYAMSFVDGSFFKIKNITLGYTLPKNIGNKIGMNHLRVYGTITNPLVIAKSHLIRNYDPEQAGSLDFPLTKQVVMGVNITF